MGKVLYPTFSRKTRRADRLRYVNDPKRAVLDLDRVPSVHFI